MVGGDHTEKALPFSGTITLVAAPFIFLFGTMKGALTLIRPSLVVSLYGRARYATMAGALAAR